jgi:L-fucose isomerase
MDNFKVGLISTVSPEFGEAGGGQDRTDAAVCLSRARQALEGMGALVVDPGEPTSQRPQAALHGRMLREQGVQALVIYIGHWTHAHTALAAVTAAEAPVVIWSVLRPSGTNLTGIGAVRGALDEAGIANSLVMGAFDDPGTLAILEAKVRAAAAVRRLHGQVFGLMGQRSMGMVTGTIDPSGWYRQFGVDVDDWDMLETVERARSIPDDSPEVIRHAAWVRAEFGGVTVTPESLRASIKLYLASRQIVGDRGYDFVAVKCLPYMPEIYTTFCFAIAMLNDDRDADGPKERVPCACESDANGALTMQVLKLLSNAPVNFADLFEIDPATRVATIANCGSQSTQLASGPKDVHWVPNEMIQFRWVHHGMSPQYIGRPGRVTIARLSRVSGDYVMLITGGEALDVPRQALEGMFAPFCPRTFVRLNCDLEELLQNMRSNHVCSVYGDYQAHLVEFCRLAGIKPVVLRSPLGKEANP